MKSFDVKNAEIKDLIQIFFLSLFLAFQLSGVEKYDESFLDDTNMFPHAVDVRILHNDKQILLEMEKNPYLDVGIPAIALREGAEGKRVYTNSDKVSVASLLFEGTAGPIEHSVLGLI